MFRSKNFFININRFSRRSFSSKKNCRALKRIHVLSPNLLKEVNFTLSYCSFRKYF